jgi:hypothetical protein
MTTHVRYNSVSRSSFAPLLVPRRERESGGWSRDWVCSYLLPTELEQQGCLAVVFITFVHPAREK